jgi:hypothetical protein
MNTGASNPARRGHSLLTPHSSPCKKVTLVHLTLRTSTACAEKLTSARGHKQLGLRQWQDAELDTLHLFIRRFCRLAIHSVTNWLSQSQHRNRNVYQFKSTLQLVFAPDFTLGVYFISLSIHCVESSGPSVYKAGSETDRLLGLGIRIPPETCKALLSVECCQVDASSTDLFLVQRSPTDCGVSLRVI